MDGDPNRGRGRGRGRRLVLFPSPFQGHISPMLQLATILHSNGFSITIIHTQFNSPNPSNYPNFTFLPISDGLLESEASTENFMTLITILNINCIIPFRDCMARLLSDDLEDPVCCLISDAPMHFTRAVADSHKLPRIVLRATSVMSFLVFAIFPLLRQKGLPSHTRQEVLNTICEEFFSGTLSYFFRLVIRMLNLESTVCAGFIGESSNASQLESPVPELPSFKVKDLPVINTHDLEDLDRFFAAMTAGTKASSGIILNSSECLEQSAFALFRQDFSIPIFPIGPFHKYCPASSSRLLIQDHNCIPWLDTQAPRSVIYVSFGSIAVIDESEFVEIAWGIANSEQPFLWVVRPGSVRGSEWIEQLPSGFLKMMSGKGCIVKWAPQQDVLAHPAVGGFWTHNGWNSTLESVCEGVPMLCLPCFGDQMVNAKYVSHVWKVGLQMENGIEREKIKKAIRRLMVDKEVEEIRERVVDLKTLVLAKEDSSYESLESLITLLLSF